MLLVAVVTPDSSRRYNAPLTLPSCEDKIPRDLLLIYLFFECVFFLRRYSHHDQCNQRVCKLQVHDRPANSSTTLILVIVIFHPSRTICIVLQFFVYVIDEPPPHCEDRHAMLFLCSRDELEDLIKMGILISFGSFLSGRISVVSLATYISV